MGELKEEERERLLKLVPPKTARTIRSLLCYAPDTAGGVMNPEVVSIRPDMTVADAVRRIRQSRDEFEDILDVYVVDHEPEFTGALSRAATAVGRSGCAGRKRQLAW